MLGYASVDELLALDLARDVYQDASERAELSRRAAISEQSNDWVEVHWKKKDGTPLTVHLSVNTVRDAAGEVLFFEGIAEDVTERRRREEVGRRSERMASLGTMLAGVAHELNNPLAAISGFAQIMMRGDRPPDDLSALETIHHEATRAAKIVKDLLTFARRQDSEVRDFIDLNAIVGYIASTRRYTLETRGINLTLDLATALSLVLGDRTQLEQVVLNLIVNAEHALSQTVDAPADGRKKRTTNLTLRTRDEGGFVVLEIEDSGAGISPGDLPRIWDPFWTTKSEGEGTGLGLPVVHGIVATHGGSIDVKSEPGVGTTFTVRLPAAAASGEASARSTQQAAKPPSASKPLDILVIDDEASIVRFLESYLTSRGHAVMVATDGPTALQLGERADFDVVICDMRMPGMDGTTVIETLRSMPHMARSRYILSTGNVDNPETKARIDALKPSAVLAKPYKIEELRRLIEDR
jgi:PAS domain S-box-containing protein